MLWTEGVGVLEVGLPAHSAPGHNSQSDGENSKLLTESPARVY